MRWCSVSEKDDMTDLQTPAQCLTRQGRFPWTAANIRPQQQNKSWLYKTNVIFFTSAVQFCLDHWYIISHAFKVKMLFPDGRNNCERSFGTAGNSPNWPLSRNMDFCRIACLTGAVSASAPIKDASPSRACQIMHNMLPFRIAFSLSLPIFRVVSIAIIQRRVSVTQK